MNDTANLLKAARVANSYLIEECNQLKVVTVEEKEVERRLQARAVELHKDLKADQEKIATQNASIVTEHEEGFYKALRQAAVILKVQEPFAIGFDIENDVYDGKLVYLGPPSGGEGLIDPIIGNPLADAAGDSGVAEEDNANK